MEYKLYKTSAKTMRENNLIQGKKDKYINCLLDFSQLNELRLSDSDKEIITKAATSYISPANRTLFYGKIIDNFTAIEGEATFVSHKVYNDNKLLYIVMELQSITHYHKSRNSVYEQCYSDIEEQHITKAVRTTDIDLGQSLLER